MSLNTRAACHHQHCVRVRHAIPVFTQNALCIEFVAWSVYNVRSCNGNAFLL